MNNQENNNIIVTIISTIVLMIIGYAIALFVVSLVTHTEFTRLLTSPYTFFMFIAILGFELFNILTRNKKKDDK